MSVVHGRAQLLSRCLVRDRPFLRTRVCAPHSSSRRVDWETAGAYRRGSRGGWVMPHYVTLVRYTQQGAAKIKESPARLDAARKAAEAAKGKIHGWYLTMGKYDAVLISEFPDDETAARFMLATAAAGNITTQTLKAFTETEYRKILGSL